VQVSLISSAFALKTSSESTSSALQDALVNAHTQSYKEDTNVDSSLSQVSSSIILNQFESNDMISSPSSSVLSSDPPPPPGYQKSCVWTQLTCDHGLYPSDKCTPYSQPPDEAHHSYPWDPCLCYPGWNGTDCSIPLPETCKNQTDPITGKALHFSGVFIDNTIDKHYECFLSDPASFHHPPDHRIELDHDPVAKTLDIVFWDRPYNKSAPSPPLPGKFGPMVDILRCHSTDCVGRTGGAKDVVAQYKCGAVQCTACGKDQGCNSIIQQIIELIHTVDIACSSVDTATGTSVCAFQSNTISFGLECYSGSCILGTPDQNFSVYNSYRWVILLLVSVSTVSCVLVSLMAFNSHVSARVLADSTKRWHAKSFANDVEDMMFKKQTDSSANRSSHRGSSDSKMNPHELALTPVVAGTMYAGDDDDQEPFLMPSLQLIWRDVSYEVVLSDEQVDLDAYNEEYASLEDTMTSYGTAAAQVCNSMCSALNVFRVCTTSTHAKSKQILTSVHGSVKSGQVMAILGLSGSGKTTLLDILAHCPKVGQVSGEVSLFANGQQIHPQADRLADFVSYVSAHDTLLPTQTVYETVHFSARLRLPSNWSDSMIHNAVMEVLSDLGLLGIAHSRVGTHEGAGISSGERKRVSIAVELVARPSVLLLDEPTSGLDSYNSYHLMMLLRRAAKRHGLLCIFSIHQPPANVFSLFDQLLLLTRNGKQAYFGPARNVLDYFASVGFTCEVDHVNPADYMLYIASRRNEQQLQQLEDAFQQSTLCAEILHDLERVMSHASPAHSPEPQLQQQEHDHNSTQSESEQQLLESHATPMRLKKHTDVNDMQFALRRPMAPFRVQFLQLVGRSFRDVSRNPALLLMHIAVAITAGCVMGFIYYGVKSTFFGVLDRAGFMYFTIFFFSLIAVTSVETFVANRLVFLREKNDRFYTTLPYVLSKLLTDVLPVRVLPPVLFSAIVYWLVGLRNDAFAFATFTFGIVLVNVVATAACFAASSISESLSNANLLAVIYFVFSTLFGGLFFSGTGGAQLTKWVSYVKYGSFFYYGFNILMTNELAGSYYVFNAKGTGNSADGPGLSGQTFLANLSLNPDEFSLDIYVLCGMFVLFFFVGFVSLATRPRQRR
jgi:ABC-type multidrug transport system ATPase subunit